MAEGVDIRYEVDDGYVGPSAPHHLTLSTNDFDVDESEAQLRTLFQESIEEHFRQNVHPVCDQEAEFLTWAQAQQAKMREEES